MGVPPWIILGAVIILVPIFVFFALQHINKQKETTTLLLVEKGAALIRSFEAGARTGMMGMMGMMGMRGMGGDMGGGMGGGGFQLQRLLMETAQQPDISYIIVTDSEGVVLAHSDPSSIGESYGRELGLERICRLETVEWRQVSNPDRADTFEVFRRFTPSRPMFGRHHRKRHQGRMMFDTVRQNNIEQEQYELKPGRIIFVGLDMGPIESARRDDARHTVFMAIILLLIGFAGIFSLFLAQAYRSARSSLTRIKAFSDNVVENMPIGLLALDTDGKIASFNETAETILQLSSREILGQKAHEILPSQLWTIIDERNDEKGIIEREIDCTLNDGKIIPLEMSVSPLEGEDDSFLGYILLFRDLTEVQNLKREIERSRRLASLGRLAAGIAHEIRNPLSSIKGFATYFRERYKEIPEDRKTAEIMVQEVERLNRVIGELLEFARPMKIRKREASIEALIQHTLKMVEGQAMEKSITLDVSLDQEIEDIPVDADRINQVLLNLYLNALDAMGDGGTLSVGLSRDDGLKSIRITVSDTGVGIRKKDLVHIFDPYFTTKQSGTGLGLAIVHRIIETHKCEVKVESELGKGTRVTILLPIF